VVIVKLTGGLGNQMFQYAAARAVALRRNSELKLDTGDFGNITGFAGVDSRYYALGCFALDVKVATKDEIMACRESWRDSLPKGLRRSLDSVTPASMLRYVKERQFNFDKRILSLGENVYMEGNWQSEKYFSDARGAIRSDFAFKGALSGRNMELASMMGQADAISLHVRRGDYVTNAKTNAVHGTCTLEYYGEAMKRAAADLAMPHFFVFSDDIAWTKANIKSEFPTTFADGNIERPYEDMHLMSLCKHHIIANSSFSWWGAWLGANPLKRVFAPPNWFASFDKDTRDLIPERWVRV